MAGWRGRDTILMVTFDNDTKGMEGAKFLNPLRLKGQSVVGVILARSVDVHE